MGIKDGFRLHSSDFLRGSPGLGLLLLRLTVGAATVAQAWLWLAVTGSPPQTLAAGFVALASAALLIAGLLTRVVALAIAFGATGIAIASLSPPGANLVALQTAAMSAALVLLGPGGWSIDARLFGRREIIIPARE